MFLTHRREPMSIKSLGDMVTGYFRLAGFVNKGYSCHTLRHSMATHLMENKTDIRAVQDILGHASIISVQICTRVSQTRAKEMHTRCHSMERQKHGML